MEAQQEYQKLINSNYNLSKKWKVRSQLALVYESQRLYKEAVQQLEKHLEEEGGDDAVVEWRIEDLKKRIVLQPGGKGRLKK